MLHPEFKAKMFKASGNVVINLPKFSQDETEAQVDQRCEREVLAEVIIEKIMEMPFDEFGAFIKKHKGIGKTAGLFTGILNGTRKSIRQSK